MSSPFQEAMATLPLIAILRGVGPSEVVEIADVLVASGFKLIEVPLTSPDPFRSIARLSTRYGDDIIVGAGTVRTDLQLREVLSAGGRLMVTPHADVALIQSARDLGFFTLPGVATPTEAFAAIDAGADALKLFPSSSIPPKTISAFRTVVGDEMHICPTGGIGPSDLRRYVEAGASGFGLGSELYRPGDRAADVQVKAQAFTASWRARYAAA